MIGSEIARFVDALELEFGLSDNTCSSYASDLNFFAQYLQRRGRTRAGEIAESDISGFLASERDDGMSGATRARRMAAIRAWLGYLNTLSHFFM